MVLFFRNSRFEAIFRTFFEDIDFLEFQEISTLSCTGFQAIFFGFEDIQSMASTQKFEETLPFGHSYNSLEAGAV